MKRSSLRRRQNTYVIAGIAGAAVVAVVGMVGHQVQASIIRSIDQEVAGQTVDALVLGSPHPLQNVIEQAREGLDGDGVVQSATQ